MKNRNREKVALAACSGMNLNGLITRIIFSDIVENPITLYQYAWVQQQLIMKIL